MTASDNGADTTSEGINWTAVRVTISGAGTELAARGKASSRQQPQIIDFSRITNRFAALAHVSVLPVPTWSPCK